MNVLQNARAINEEKPEVEILNGNYSYAYIDPEVNTDQPDKSNIVISSKISNNSFANILINKPRRLGISSLQISTLFNVNARNNNIRFRVSGGTTIYSVFVKEGFYKNPADLMAEIVIALNSITGTTGATFSQAIASVVNSDSRFDLICSTTYNIDTTCNAVTRGKFLWNMPTSQNFALTKQVGPMYMFYTRYVDVISDDLLQYTKSTSTANSAYGSGNNLIRIQLFPAQQGENLENQERIFNIIIPTISLWFNFNNQRTISSINFRLIDEFGEPVYSYSNPDVEGDGNFKWQLALIAQY